jgi:glutathione S-transferase
MRYIANKWQPDHNGRTIEEKARVDMSLGVLQSLNSTLVNTHSYQTGDKQALVTAAETQFEQLIKFMGDRPFLAGDNITFVDFFLFELINLVDFVSEGNITSISTLINTLLDLSTTRWLRLTTDCSFVTYYDMHLLSSNLINKT